MSAALGLRADPPFICTKTISNKSPDLNTRWSEWAVSFRIASTSTTPHHSPPLVPLKDTSRQRLATRAVSARNRISVQRSVWLAFFEGEVECRATGFLCPTAGVGLFAIGDEYGRKAWLGGVQY